jgi:hypothetical protein
MINLLEMDILMVQVDIPTKRQEIKSPGSHEPGDF